MEKQNNQDKLLVSTLKVRKLLLKFLKHSRCRIGLFVVLKSPLHNEDFLLYWGPHTQREESRLECTRHGVQLKLPVCGEECGTRIQVSWNQNSLDFWRAHSNPRGDNFLRVATSRCMLQLKFSSDHIMSDLRNTYRLIHVARSLETFWFPKIILI
jgi:hypothetical protein